MYAPTFHHPHINSVVNVSRWSPGTQATMKSTAVHFFLCILTTGSHAFLSSPQSRAVIFRENVSFRGQIQQTRSYPICTALSSLNDLTTHQSTEHPSDNAKTTPQLLHALWGLISDASKNMQRGDSFTVLFPHMEQLSNGNYVTKLLAHLDACKDVCDNFGVNTIIAPHLQPGTTSKVIGFTVKSYRNPNAAGTFNDDAANMKFAPDPFWDEDEVWDFSGLDVDELTDQEKKLKSLPEIEDRIPTDDDVIIETSKRWVDRMMADLALCPFTRSAEKSGIPLGPVRYAVDRVMGMEDAYAAYWQEVCLIEGVEEGDVSTTLQILPEFCMNSVESEFLK
jgi:hypothetical protein